MVFHDEDFMVNQRNTGISLQVQFGWAGKVGSFSFGKTPLPSPKSAFA